MAVALDNINHFVVAGEDNEGVAPVNIHRMVGLDFDVAAVTVQHDVHIIGGLKLADGIAVQKRAGLDLQANHAVIDAVDMERLGDFNTDG